LIVVAEASFFEALDASWILIVIFEFPSGQLAIDNFFSLPDTHSSVSGQIPGISCPLGIFLSGRFGIIWMKCSGCLIPHRSYFDNSSATLVHRKQKNVALEGTGASRP
jgi:hypothetical protein